MFKLRDYQFLLAEQIQAEFRNTRAVCLQLETGAGKTAIAAYIAHRIHCKHGSRKGGVVLFLVHRRELIGQVCKTLEFFGMAGQFGVIASGYAPTPWAPIQIASIQTLSRRLTKSAHLKPLLIIVDEAHHARAKTWHTTIDHFEKSRILGLTATPARMDGKGLGEIFDIIIEGPTMRCLINDNYLCDLDTYSLPTRLDMSHVRKVAGDYAKNEADKKVTTAVIASAVRNWLKFALNKRTIHFAVSIRHSKAFVSELKEVGISAEHVDGSMSNAIRDAIFRRFEQGTTQVISSVDIVSEGFDCPECDCVVLDRATLSYCMYKQQVGRVMRPKSDGRKGLVLDLVGNLHRHGNVDNVIEWDLADGIIKETVRKAVSKLRICDCGYSYPRRFDKCPICETPASQRIIQESEVDLVLQKQRIAAKQKGGTGIKREVNYKVYKTFGDENKMKELYIEYGYSPKIVRIWKQMFKNKWNNARRYKI